MGHIAQCRVLDPHASMSHKKIQGELPVNCDWNLICTYNVLVLNKMKTGIDVVFYSVQKPRYCPSLFS